MVKKRINSKHPLKFKIEQIADQSCFHTFKLIMLILMQALLTAQIRYVSKNGSSTPPYTSWATAEDSTQKGTIPHIVTNKKSNNTKLNNICAGGKNLDTL